MQGSVTPDSNRAANLVVIFAIIAAVLCIFLGVWDLIERQWLSGTLLILLSLVPLVLGGQVRKYFLRGRGL